MSVSKLVRDRIPEILLDDGEHFSMRVLSDEELIEALADKLSEEVSEFKRDLNLEELADILEVVYACTESLGYTKQDLESERIKKKMVKGGFSKKYFVRIG